MNYNYSIEQPNTLVTNSPTRLFNFDIEETTSISEDTQELHQLFKYLTVTLSIGQWSYNNLIAAIVRCKYSANDIEAIILNGDTTELNELNDWRDHAKALAANQFKVNQTLEGAQKEKIRQINAYDRSSAVNSFILNGISMWLDKDTRVGLKSSVQDEISIGRETTTLWFNNLNFVIPCNIVLQLLASIEVYAKDCYNVTALHKQNVENLTTVEEVNAYDYTSNYPDKLVINLND